MTGANARRPTNKAKRTDGTLRFPPPWTVEETDAATSKIAPACRWLTSIFEGQFRPARDGKAAHS